MAYTKGEKLKLVYFWSIVLSIICFIIEGIVAVAAYDFVGVLVLFILAVIFAAVAFGVWLYIKVKRTNRKVTA